MKKRVSAGMFAVVLLLVLALAGCGSKGSFEFEISDVFQITGRGTVVTGKVTAGSVKVGDTVVLVKEDGTEVKTKVVAIEKFRELLEEAVEGDNVGIELENLTKDQISAGDRLEN